MIRRVIAADYTRATNMASMRGSARVSPMKLIIYK